MKILTAASLAATLLGSPPPTSASASSTAALRGGSDVAPTSRDLQQTTTSTTFPVDLSFSVCPDLTEVNRMTAPSSDACAAVCASDPGCDLWQYCKKIESTNANSCRLHDATGNGDAWTSGNWIRCYISTSASSRDACLPERYAGQWIGAGRSSAEGTRVPSASIPASRKRGLSAYLDVDLSDGVTTNPPTCADGEALGLQDSWYYTWQARSSSGDYCAKVDRLWGAGPNDNGGGGVQLGKEFVPMIIGVGNAQHVLDNIDQKKAEWTRANVHYLLGYNEPDPSPNHPHEVEARIAAQDWPLVQRIAQSFDPPLKLVSPCPASEDFDDDGRSAWLDDFFGNCTHEVEECDPSSVEYIAFHDYRGSVDGLRRRIDGMYAHYGNRPLWLTEYAVGRWEPPNGPLRPEQDAYLERSLTLLENHPAVFRYVWFHSRNGPGPWGGVKDLLVWDQHEPNITSTGVIYRDAPEGPSPAPTDSPVTPPPTGSPTVPTYEAEPGLFLLLSEPGDSCTSACTDAGMVCSEASLRQGASYGFAASMADTVSRLGVTVTCSSVTSEKSGRHFPQVRPDNSMCAPKADNDRFGCEYVSSW
eukprot:CAMPEP_0183706518 /NCGR_PEP_ID=MMETSP0737-20130205/3311_1 /TAXON_ID=385413 /ORGANISM="Thalassiosira miniscula, Strain CCMP1093" /LENGTH=586 /DNA_ID=CAMNT_0025933933 /DNA_START=91 /DNA_END=1848 /DNA_ORIENTATION=+